MFRALVPRLLVLAVAFFAARTGYWVFCVLWCTGLLLIYTYSLHRMETVTCWACNGGKQFAHRGLLGWLWPRARGNCWRCHGRGGWTRWGVRVFRRERAAELASKG